MTLPKGPYNANTTEEEILNYWLTNNFYKPEYHKEKGLLTKEEFNKDNRDSFCIINPPPNAYMRPHIGNVSGYAYQDVFLRYNRLLGKKVLGQPGKDHAGIQGEVVLENLFINNKGKNKKELGRDKFYKASFTHFEKLIPKVIKDEQAIGLSSDYDRNLFTLDPKIVNTILQTFIQMFKDDMVYKGVRIVNWDPVAKTTLADIDTERITRKTSLVFINYPLKKPINNIIYIQVATTRAETMLGDTAVVVHPKDKRYTKLIGQKVVLPLVNREIPIITSERVDKDFGTGAVKLTPAHAYDDYVMMTEWNNQNPTKQINYINIIDKNGEITGPVPQKYEGLKSEDCKKVVIDDLKKLGLIAKTLPHEQSIMIGERSKAVVEQIMSSQWFIKVDKLKKPAINAVKTQQIKIFPKYMTKKFMHWMTNLQDWPVSRSLWWGYRIPVWYKGNLSESINKEGQVIEYIGKQKITDLEDANKKGLIKVQIDSPGKEWVQDPDVFDTWFSSGQWPYATLKANELYDQFYPTDVMETAYDILELWVSRMIMLSLYTQNKIPFKNVYFHGLVKAPDGQKMSKSKGNVINPEEIIKTYGADSLRMLYIAGNKAGASYPISYEKLEGYKRFLNKIWNASKFVLANISLAEKDLYSLKKEELELKPEDIKMLKTIKNLSFDTKKRLESYNLGIGAQILYESFWHTFADIYLEEVKLRLYTKDKNNNPINQDEESKKSRLSAQWTLYQTLKSYLILLHPFIPFITEKIWQNLPKSTKESKTIMYANWPFLED